MSSSELQAALLALDEITAQRDDARRQLEVMTHEHRLACVDRDAMQRERDEARRSCCGFAAMVDSADTVVMYVDRNRFHEIAMRYMKSRGWDCFKEDKPCQ
jgi:hypothetical protein